MHIHSGFHTLFFQVGADMRFLFIKIYNLFVFAAFMRFCSGCYINGLQNIGLSLRIVSVKDIGSLIELNIKKFIISVIRQLQSLNNLSLYPLLILI